MKKTLAIILSIVLLLSSIPMAFTASAATYERAGISVTDNGGKLYKNTKCSNCSGNKEHNIKLVNLTKPADPPFNFEVKNGEIWLTVALNLHCGSKIVAQQQPVTFNTGVKCGEGCSNKKYILSNRTGTSSSGSRTKVDFPDAIDDFLTLNNSFGDFPVTVNISKHNGVSNVTSNNNGTHNATCARCGTFSEKCYGGTATCYAPATCTACKTAYGSVNNSHSWSAWTYADETNHIRTCANDPTHKETAQHSGGTANCSTLATCGTCNKQYGTTNNDHDWLTDGTCARNPAHICTHAGYEGTSPCGTCGKALHVHAYTYTAEGAVITATCTAENCPDTDGGWVEIITFDCLYTGSALEYAQLHYSPDWAGTKDLTITYENNIEIGEATASVTVDEATATAKFDIVADWTEADMLVKSLEDEIDDLTLTDSAKALFAEYKATLDTYKADKLTSQADVDVLVANLKAFDEAIKDKSAIAPDFSELEEAYRTLTTVMHENLTDEAEAKLEEVLADYDSAKASANQKELLEVQTAVIDAMIDFVNEVIDNDYVKADYTAVDTAFAALVAPEGEELTAEAEAAIAEIKAVIDALKAEDTSETELDAADDTILADIAEVAAAIADTSYLKADYTEIYNAFAELVAPEGEELTEEAVAAIAEIKATIDALKAEDTSKTELDAADDAINADIAEVAAAIADESYLKADYTEIDAAFAELVAPEGEELTEEGVGLIATLKADIDNMKADCSNKKEFAEHEPTYMVAISSLKTSINDGYLLKADYTEIDAAFAELVAPEGEELTDEAVAAIEEIKAAIDALKAEDTSKAELDAADDTILADIAEVVAAIADTSYLKADYTEIDNAFAELVAPDGEALTGEAVAAIEKIKAAIDALKTEDTSKTELDEADDVIYADMEKVAADIESGAALKADFTAIDEAAAALVAPEGEELTEEAAKKISTFNTVLYHAKSSDLSKTQLSAKEAEFLAEIEEIKAYIESGEGLKADTTAADELLAQIDEIIAEGKFDDAETLAKLEEIRAEIEAIKADGNASKAEYQARVEELVIELEAVYEYCQECEYCGNIHTTMLHEYICVIILFVKLVVRFYNTVLAIG